MTDADMPSDTGGSEGRRNEAGRSESGRSEDDPVCPLCGRPITAASRASLHHVVPRLKGGARGPKVLLHQICHNEIHATFTEAELAREGSIEALRRHPRLARFIAWVARRPPEFHAPTPGPRRNRRRGRGR